MKTYQSNTDLINLLSQRGLQINNQRFALKVLDYENYYTVINGYKDLFILSTDPSDVYKKGSSFDEIIALYTFDRRLRELLLTELLRIEHVLKTRIVHTFSKYHGHNHTDYLRPQCFNSTDFTNFKRTNALIFDVIKLIEKQQKIHSAISHYLHKHGYVPMWVLAKVMTFGKINSFYACMLQAEREEIAVAFNLNVKDFKPIIDFLARIRNKCAHGERIYCNSKDLNIQTSIPTLPEHAMLQIPVNSSNRVSYGDNDILALLIVLKYFMQPNRYSHLLDKINYALHGKLERRLHSVSITDVENVMGLNCDWLSLK